MRIPFLTAPFVRLTVLALPGLAALLWVMAAGWGSDGLRALAEMPPGFWVSLMVGLTAYLVSVWIWAFRPTDPAATLFAASGVATLMFTFAAAYRMTGEASAVQGVISNALGASAFGIIMIWLFLIYPSRLAYWRWVGGAATVVFGGWTLMRLFGPFRDYAELQLITFCEMLVIMAMVVWQVAATRADPRQNAIARWLGASVLLGAGGFIATVALPISLGFPPLLTPYYAFAFFLLIYAGLAVGLVRYRLFNLGGWAFQLMFHSGLALSALLVDMFLLGVLSLAPGMALGLTLVAVTGVYLPLRDLAWRRLTRRQEADPADLFRSVVEAALKPSGPARARHWQDMLERLYRPLELTAVAPGPDAPQIANEGLALHLPAVGDAPALSLRYPHLGRALFSPRDRTLATQMIDLMRHVEESRGAYDRGVSEERTRIARDIHDNIGAQLLRALHSGEATRKDAMIRDTLADLRDVINNAQSNDLPLDLVLADLRAETADRLGARGLELIWQVQGLTDVAIGAARIHALRSLVREATSNTLKHAQAAKLTVRIDLDADALALRIADDGRGCATDGLQLGHGLNNMKARVESLGGSFRLSGQPGGTCLDARIPFAPSGTQP